MGGLRTYERIETIPRPNRSISINNRNNNASAQLKQHLRQYHKSVDQNFDYSQQRHMEILATPKRRPKSDQKLDKIPIPCLFDSMDARKSVVRSGEFRSGELRHYGSQTERSPFQYS